MLFSIHKKFLPKQFFVSALKFLILPKFVKLGATPPRRYGYDSRGALPVAGEKQ